MKPSVSLARSAIAAVLAHLACCAGPGDVVTNPGVTEGKGETFGYRKWVAAKSEPDVAIIDLALGSDSGLDLLPRIKTATPDSEIVLMSGTAQRAAAIKDRHAFKTEMDEEAQRAMFPQNERLKKGAASAAVAGR